MEQENLEEYKVEVIEKYNEATKKTLRNRNIFTLCTIVSAVVTVGASILSNDFDYDKLRELSDNSVNYTIRSGLTAIMYNVSSSRFTRYAKKCEEDNFSSIHNLEESYELERRNCHKESLMYNVLLVVLLGCSVADSIFMTGNIVPLITMSPYLTYFGSMSKQMKNVSNEYKKELTKIKK